jgi:hypothetical protein
LAAGEEFVEAAEAGQDGLLHLAVGPDVIDEEQLGAGTVGLGADEQGCAPVSPSLPPFHARRNILYCSGRHVTLGFRVKRFRAMWNQ